MAQHIKIQDGRVVYSASDPAYGIDFAIKGQLSLGIDASIDGVLTTPSNTDLSIIPGASGLLLLRNMAWPDGTVTPNIGKYLGASASNVLQFYSFILATVSSDSLSVADLNTSYPSAQAGQSVVGPTVVYECVGPSVWRFLRSTSENKTSTILNFDSIGTLPAIILPANAIIGDIQVVIDTPFDSTPDVSIGILGNNTKYAVYSDITLVAPAKTVSLIYPGCPANGAAENINFYYARNGATVGSARVLISYSLPI